MQIVAALRVKNEARWIEEVLEAISWCDATYLMDDHSTDDTAKIAVKCGAKVLFSPFKGHDEGRDKEWLTREIASKHEQGTWVLMIDGDEVLEPDGENIIRNSIRSNPHKSAFTLRIKYLWNSRDMIRVDGVYGRFRRQSLFRLDGNYSFKRTGVKGNLHCHCVPGHLASKAYPCPAALLHLGYMDREDRIRKWRYYNSIDPINRKEGYDPAYQERGSYPWIIQGDVPEVPVGAKLLHAGPLELRPL